MLRPGDRIMFDGEPCEVVRVNACAAYIKRARTRIVEVVDRKTGEARRFEAHDSNLIAISPNSVVERVA